MRCVVPFARPEAIAAATPCEANNDASSSLTIITESCAVSLDRVLEVWAFYCTAFKCQHPCDVCT